MYLIGTGCISEWSAYKGRRIGKHPPENLRAAVEWGRRQLDERSGEAEAAAGSTGRVNYIPSRTASTVDVEVSITKNPLLN
jgi:hypothetical protein